MIEVKVFATFRIGRQKSYQLDPSQYKTGLDVCNYLNIKPKDVAIFLINGFHGSVEDSLKDGDLISMFPPCAGG